MKNLLVAISMTVAALTLTLAPHDVDAKRLGAGKPAGMQRQAPANAAPQNAPAQAARPTAPAPAPAAVPATPPKRNWLGPLAGVAAGIGLASLFGSMGGGGMGGSGGGMGIFSMLLLAGVAFFAIRFVMNRMRGGASSPMGGSQLAGAGGPAMGGWQPQAAPAPVALQRETLDAAPAAGFGALGGPAPATAAIAIPGGMATADFERLAKMVFIRLQAANDSNNIDDLRKFTTPELFASLRLDLQDRGAAKQQTDVVQIDAQVVETVRENAQDIVSVRFHGLIREEAGAGAEPFNELWHLVRPADGQGDWSIAGITPIN